MAANPMTISVIHTATYRGVGGATRHDRRREAPRSRLQLSGARDITLPSSFSDRYSLTAARRAANQNGHSGGAHGQRMAGPDSVSDVHRSVLRLDDGDADRIRPIADRQMGGGACPLGQHAKVWARCLLQVRA